MFRVVYLIVLAKKLCQMTKFKTRVMFPFLLENLSTKLTVTVGVFSIELTYSDISGDETDSINPEEELHSQ